MDTKYIGVAILILFMIYFVAHMGTRQRNLIEGLRNRDDDDDDDNGNGNDDSGSNCGSNSEKISEKVKDMKTKILDGLLIDKYRDNYEDILINLDDWASASIIKALVCGKIDPSDDVTSDNSRAKKTIATIALVKDLDKFRDILNNAMKSLDKL